jgi:predicted phosphoribosyltransferase
VDDGVATGSTIKAADMTLRKEELRKLVAVPVAPRKTAEELKGLDELHCLS